MMCPFPYLEPPPFTLACRTSNLLLLDLQRLPRLELLEHLIPRHKQGQRDRGPLDLRLRRPVADLRVQSLGLDLWGSMTTETTPLKRRPVQRNA